MSTEVERWVEAGKVLAVNPSAPVSCPRCQKAQLVVDDVAMPGSGGIIERHLRCPRCQAYNALRLSRPPANEAGDTQIRTPKGRS